MSDNEVFWCNLLVCTVFEASILGFFVRARYWRQICWRVIGSLACVPKYCQQSSLCWEFCYIKVSRSPVRTPLYSSDQALPLCRCPSFAAVLLRRLQQLFRSAGISQRLYDEFLEPMLLVLPMCPGEDCSAAAALSCFQYFALEHQVLSMSFRHTVKCSGNV